MGLGFRVFDALLAALAAVDRLPDACSVTRNTQHALSECGGALLAGTLSAFEVHKGPIFHSRISIEREPAFSAIFQNLGPRLSPTVESVVHRVPTVGTLL